MKADYSPPFWIFNSWINVFVFIMKQRITTFRDRNALQRTFVTAPDGSRLFVDWLKEDEDKLPVSAPLLLILPTISGDGQSRALFHSFFSFQFLFRYLIT